MSKQPLADLLAGRTRGSAGWKTGQNNNKSKMQFCRADRPAETVDFILAYRPHSDLLAKISNVSARPVQSTAGLLDRRVNRPASKTARTYVSELHCSAGFLLCWPYFWHSRRLCRVLSVGSNVLMLVTILVSQVQRLNVYPLAGMKERRRKERLVVMGFISRGQKVESIRSLE